MPNILNILKKTVFSKEPFGLLILLAIAMPIAFSTWVALLNNFVIEVSGFSGVEIGWLQSVREIPGLVFYKRTKTCIHIASSSGVGGCGYCSFP